MKSMDEEQIRLQLDAFVKAWESGEEFVIDQCVVEEPYIYFSMFGKCYIKNTLNSWLKKRELNPGYIKLKIENHTCLIKGNRAEQYATLLGVFADTDSEGISYLSFGGTFVNTLVKKNEVWKFETMRFELQSDNGVLEETLLEEGIISIVEGPGNREFIKNWKLVNDRVGYYMDPLEEQGEHVILGELDAPWYKVENRDNLLTNEEQIKDLFAKYCFSYDFSLFVLMKDIFSEDAVIKLPDQESFHRQDALAYLKLVRQGSPRSMTTGYFLSLEIEGEKAECRVVRELPEALRLTSDRNDFWDSDFSCGTYFFKVEKKEGDWKICYFEYEEDKQWKSQVMNSI